MASTASARREFRAEPYEYAHARRLAVALDLAEPIAVTLVRRGYDTVEAAREFLDARDEHDPFEFDGMEDSCERILGAAAAGARITVHGDYDVDGVCSTAILVATLRELGGTCDWLIPDRMGGGYGLSETSVLELQRRGTDLAVTVDCGIGSAEEVASARAAGIEMIVTDHHEPPERLPDCPILHPSLSGYPFSALCAAGVAHKLALGLRRVAGVDEDPAADIDLVALATVADMVPLIGENRRMVRQGLGAIRSSPRPGLAALMTVARVEPETVDEGALGFRLAPRINAVGRLYRADAGVELMLTEDRDRAAAIADELDHANSERRATERQVTQGAGRAVAELPPEQAGARALVLAGEGWHPGVVGIAASRLAEEHWRPTVLLNLDGDRARGSARSIPGFDLIAALDACSQHLSRYGGHRAAAGLELERGRLDAFREAFIAHAELEISDADLVRTESVDALVGVGRDGIGMQLAEQLERLGPFGMGNPDPRLIVPSARLDTVRPMGEEGRHSRFQLRSGAGSAQGVAFGTGTNGGELAGREGERLDLSVRLELDRWNGAVQPRVVLKELYPHPPVDGEDDAPAVCNKDCPSPAEEWWRRLVAEMEGFDDSWPLASLEATPLGGARREAVDRRRGAAVAAIAELLSSGESVLALCADAGRRRELALAAADPRRFGAGSPRIACARCGDAALDSALGSIGAAEGAVGFALADWSALGMRPGASLRFDHIVLIDPPPFERLEEIARAGGGFLHLAWGREEVGLAELCCAREWDLRAPIAEIWRGLRDGGGELAGEELRALLAGAGRYPRSPEVAARCVRVLTELELCRWSLDRGAGALGVLSSERTELERSRAFAAADARHQEARQYLRSRAQSS